MYREKKYLVKEYIEKNRSESDIAKEWGIDPKLLHYYIKKNNLVGIKSRRKYTVDEGKLSMTDPVFCYYAGLIATDGYIDHKNHRVSLRVKNKGSKEVLQALADYFSFTGSVKMYKGCYDLTITSDVLISKLGSLRVKDTEQGKKTYTLKFPAILPSSEDCQRMFVRGILDGDGNIHIYTSSYTNKVCGGQFRIVTASHDFIAGLTRYINRKFGFEYKVSIAKLKGIEYPKLEMKVEDSKTFYKWLYKNFEEFRFSDKYNKYMLIVDEDIV